MEWIAGEWIAGEWIAGEWIAGEWIAGEWIAGEWIVNSIDAQATKLFDSNRDTTPFLVDRRAAGKDDWRVPNMACSQAFGGLIGSNS